MSRETTTTTSTEFEILLLCASGPFCEITRNRLRFLLGKGINSQRLSLMAERHGLTSLLFRNLQQLPIDEWPNGLLPILKTRTFRWKAQYLLQLGQMIKIQKSLIDSHINVIYYKGLVLDELLYNAQALRMSSDLDILIEKHDIAKIKPLLATLGYVPRDVESERQERFLLQQAKDYVFIHPKLRHVVEVHWLLFDKRINATLGLDRFWSRRQQLSIQDIPFQVMSIEDLVWVLASHGSKHEWESLKWLCDIHELIRQFPEMDWCYIKQISREYGFQRAVDLGVLLTAIQLETPLPQPIHERSQNPKAVQRMYNHIISGWLNDADDTSRWLRRQPFQILLLDRWNDRLRFLFIAIFGINMKDITSLDVPRWLMPFYSIIRPMRIILNRGIADLIRIIARLFRNI